jgi:hypothetical protein
VTEPCPLDVQRALEQRNEYMLVAVGITVRGFIVLRFSHTTVCLPQPVTVNVAGVPAVVIEVGKALKPVG